MKKLALLAFLGLMSSVPAFAQGDYAYENDRRYCASGRSGLDFDSCMWRLQDDRDRYERREYERRRQWREPPPPVYVPEYQPQPQPYAPQWQWQQEPERPRLSDMQQRALDNCNLLARRDQPRCRATVMSTVR